MLALAAAVIFLLSGLNVLTDTAKVHWVAIGLCLFALHFVFTLGPTYVRERL